MLNKLLTLATIGSSKKWIPMGKSITNLYRYVEISKSITNRYIEALPNVDLNTVPLKDITNISQRKCVNNRMFSGFNILCEDTLLLFKTIANGDYLINGFNNKEIRRKILVNSEDKSNINRITRLFAKLRAHQIIKKITRQKQILFNK